MEKSSLQVHGINQTYIYLKVYWPSENCYIFFTDVHRSDSF